MRTLARVGLVILAVVFSLASLFNLLRFFNEFGVSPARFVIEDAVIALACVVIVVACCMKFRQIGKAQAAEVAATLGKDGRPEFKGSRLEASASKLMIGAFLLLVATALAFGLFRVWLAPTFGTILLTGLGLVVAAFLGGTFLAYFRSGKPTLVMDSYSLDHAWYGPIRWDQINGMQFLQVSGSRGSKQQVLVLGVIKPGRYLQQLPWTARLFVTRQRMDAAVGELRIPLNILNQPAALIHAAALELRGRVSPPLPRFWVPGMTAEQIAVQRETDATLARMEQLSAALSETAPVSTRESEEMLRLSEDLKQQLEAGKPLRDSLVAKARRAKLQMYVVFGAFLLYWVLRIWWRIQHPH